MFLVGFLLFAYLGGNKLFCLYQGIEAKNIATQSSFYIALTAMIIGVQLFLAGFLAELVNRNAPERNKYNIETEIGL